METRSKTVRSVKPADSASAASASAASATASATVSAHQKCTSKRARISKATKESRIRQRLQTEDQKDVARMLCSKRTDEAEAVLGLSGVVVPPAAEISINNNVEEEALAGDAVQLIRSEKFGYPDWRTFGAETEHQNRLLCLLHIYDNHHLYKGINDYPTGEVVSRSTSRFLFEPGHFSIHRKNDPWSIWCVKCANTVQLSNYSAVNLSQHAASCPAGATSRRGKAKAHHDDVAKAVDARLRICSFERAKIDPETNKIGLGKTAIKTLNDMGRYAPKMEEDEWIAVTTALGINGHDPAIRSIRDEKKSKAIYNLVLKLVRGDLTTQSKRLRHVVDNLWRFRHSSESLFTHYESESEEEYDSNELDCDVEDDRKPASMPDVDEDDRKPASMPVLPRKPAPFRKLPLMTYNGTQLPELPCLNEEVPSAPSPAHPYSAYAAIGASPAYKPADYGAMFGWSPEYYHYQSTMSHHQEPVAQQQMVNTSKLFCFPTTPTAVNESQSTNSTEKKEIFEV